MAEASFLKQHPRVSPSCLHRDALGPGGLLPALHVDLRSVHQSLTAVFPKLLP